jgi:hypothetical protein
VNGCESGGGKKWRDAAVDCRPINPQQVIPPQPQVADGVPIKGRLALAVVEGDPTTSDTLDYV